MVLFRIMTFLRYILFAHSKKGHGIHSPFIFDIVSNVFRNKIDPEIVFIIEKVRTRLRSDKRTIRITDLGSGFERNNNKTIKVCEIAQNSPVPAKYGILLANMALRFGQSSTIELGTSFGLSTMYMASANTHSDVYTIEGCSAIAEIARENFNEAGLGNIRMFTGSFEEILEQICNRGVTPGLVYIDGDHRRVPLLKYFKKITEIADQNTVIIIDDINYSKDMKMAWDEIKSFESVTATIDIYRMGIVLFKKGINTQDYMVRY